MTGDASTVDFQSSRYMSFGHNGSWYRHYHVGKECKNGKHYHIIRYLRLLCVRVIN